MHTIGAAGIYQLGQLAMGMLRGRGAELLNSSAFYCYFLSKG